MNKCINSYGIICIKIDNSILISVDEINSYLNTNNIDVEKYNLENILNLNKIDDYKNKIKFLLVQRKHSFSYVDFIRGKYDENNIDEVLILLHLMTKDEIINILNTEFEKLWDELWQESAKYEQFKKEFNISKQKFNSLKININMIDFNKLYDTPEWGFPKGRKNKYESNVKCAFREFTEETNIQKNQIILLNKLNNFEENIISKNTLYKLIYYIGLSSYEHKLNIANEYQKTEIGDIKWVAYEDIQYFIRDYYKDKLSLINNIFFIIINLLENILQKNETSVSKNNILNM